jgi:hypothetical protein
MLGTIRTGLNPPSRKVVTGRILCLIGGGMRRSSFLVLGKLPGLRHHQHANIPQDECSAPSSTESKKRPLPPVNQVQEEDPGGGDAGRVVEVLEIESET